MVVVCLSKSGKGLFFVHRGEVFVTSVSALESLFAGRFRGLVFLTPLGSAVDRGIGSVGRGVDVLPEDLGVFSGGVL